PRRSQMTVTTTPDMTVAERIEAVADQIAAEADRADELGTLPDETVKLLKESGVVRMLQPKEFGGTEDSPVEFFKRVMQIGALSGSAGWVAGVVGIHTSEEQTSGLES